MACVASCAAVGKEAGRPALRCMSSVFLVCALARAAVAADAGYTLRCKQARADKHRFPTFILFYPFPLVVFGSCFAPRVLLLSL